MKVILTPLRSLYSSLYNTPEELDHQDIEEDCGTHRVPGDFFFFCSFSNFAVELLLISHLTAQRPAMEDFPGDTLSHPMLITVPFLF